ncbi:MAG: dehydrogenase [Dehalococcoidia bacterium]|nr:dehydrogenase [Dehalococcoidia bacterium]
MANTEQVRVAFIGAGSLASRYHYPSVASFPDVELAATSDLIEEKARDASERFGIPRVYTDYRQMLDDADPQVVYVIMPPQHLFEPASTVLKQGRHLFVEKPPALTTLQAEMLAYFATEHGCLTAVGFQRRFVPALTALKARVEERGPVHAANVYFLKSARQNRTRHAAFYDGVVNPLACDGIHAVDNLRFLCGGEVETVSAQVRRRYVPGPCPNEFTALVSFSSGAVGIVQYSVITGRRIFRAELHGPDITAYVDADRDSSIVHDDGEPEGFESRSFGTAGGAPGDQPQHWLGFWHESRYFIDCVKAGTQPHNNLADAAKSMALVDQILAAGTM